MRRRYTAQEKSQIIKLRQQGVKMGDISVQLGIPLTAVKKTLVKAGITVSSEVRSNNASNKLEFDYEKLKTLRAEGKGSADIVAAMGVTANQLLYRLRKVDAPISREAINNNKRKHSDGLIDEICGLRIAGTALEDISKCVGLPVHTVRFLLSKRGVVLTKEQHSANMRDYVPEVVDKIIELRKQGMPRVDIAKTIPGTTIAGIKHVLFNNRILVEKGVASKNVYSAKLVKNPNYMEDMRKALTPDVIARRSEAVRLAYQNEDLRKLQSERTKAWWAGLDSDTKAVFIEKRRESLESSVAFQTHLEKLRQSVGVDNYKSAALLKQFGVDSFAELMDVYAKKNNGKCHNGKDYKGIYVKLLWGCHKGHEFEMRPNNVQQGQWCPKCFDAGRSKGQLEVFDFVKTLSPDAQYNDRVQIHPKELDIYVPSANLGIEYNGLFWHSSASPGYRSGAHLEKATDCQAKGINLFVIFEDEWNNPDKQILIKKMLAWRLNKFAGTKLNARSLELRRLESNSQFREFFTQHHIDGHTNAKYAYGLFHNEQLVACASYRVNFNGQLEVARLATHQDYAVRGGAGRLLAPLVDQDLWTFSNNRVGVGRIYQNLGFQEVVRRNTPSYYYTDGQIRIWRYRCRRNNDPKILAEHPTEQDQALAGVFSDKIFGDSRPLWRLEDYGHKLWFRSAKVVLVP